MICTYIFLYILIHIFPLVPCIIYMHIYICLVKNEMNSSNDKSDRKKELRLFCYKVLDYL